MTKKDLRKEYLAKRLALSDEERQVSHQLLLDYYTQIPLPAIRCIMSYIAMEQKKEVVPTGIENWLTLQYPESLLCYPKTNPVLLSMDALLHVEGAALATSVLGVAEPVTGKAVSPQHIDVILVPLLVVDERGFRVGYGKGFYDRFITRCRPDVITIGLSYFEPITAIADVDRYDVPLQYCITPRQLHVF